MGLQSVFFLVSQDDMPRVLRGWKEPAPLLTVPVARPGLNPFTRTPELRMSWQNPDQPSADVDAVEAPTLSAGDPTFYWKWVTEYQLAQIMFACGLTPSLHEASEQCGGERMNGPENAYGMVHRVPQLLAAELASASDVRLSEVAASFVRSREGEYPPWDQHDAEELLAGIRALAATAEYPRVALYLHQGMP